MFFLIHDSVLRIAFGGGAAGSGCVSFPPHEEGEGVCWDLSQHQFLQFAALSGL